MEILVIGGALMLIVGPAAAPKLLAGFDSMRKARGMDKVTKANEALKMLTGQDAEPPENDAEEVDSEAPGAGPSQ